jgi:hypothetical protein
VRGRRFKSPKRLWVLAATLVFLAIAVPARADDVTLDFSGTVDLSRAGGPASSTYSGSVTWDPSSSPVYQENSTIDDLAEYAPVAESFTLNSTDISGSILDSDISVFVLPGAGGFDSLSVSFGFFDEVVGPPKEVGGTYLETFEGQLGTPPGEFGGTSPPVTLPGNLDFLGSVSATESTWTLGDSPVFEASSVTETVSGTFGATAPGSGSGSGSGTTSNVPEPSSLSLSLLGICALGFLVLKRKVAPIGSAS